MDDLERAAGLDLTGLDHGQRWAARTHRASELAAQLCQIQADLVAFTTELLTSGGWAGDGVRSPEHGCRSTPVSVSPTPANSSGSPNERPI